MQLFTLEFVNWSSVQFSSCAVNKPLACFDSQSIIILYIRDIGFGSDCCGFAIFPYM